MLQHVTKWILDRQPVKYVIKVSARYIQTSERSTSRMVCWPKLLIIQISKHLFDDVVGVRSRRSFSGAHSNYNRHEQSNLDHNRLNIAEHRVLDQNISQYLSLFWIATVIINIHLNKRSIFVHSHVDKSIKNLKMSLQELNKMMWLTMEIMRLIAIKYFYQQYK